MSHSTGQCHSRLGYHEPETFDLNACAWCYEFLFSLDQKTLYVTFDDPYLRNREDPSADVIVPDITNKDNTSRICSTLTTDECQRWKSCCSSAHECCSRQLSAPSSGNGTCRRTWDGWGCWDDAPPDTSMYLSCPSFILFSIPTSKILLYYLSQQPPNPEVKKIGSSFPSLYSFLIRYTPVISFGIIINILL